ncbi:YdcF family protein [Paraburkholderia sp. MMS20-SJTN17]|uniref:YdcF family protein n=2 Tax=Paraburkholderia translucens TaxID=2886945 RepID=A0ABS8K9V6_9BURK|nr:YdcF family protein [Paraburkholderia sp. MMS20-SJTN17]MCC8401531.1 YdcF family protein [Paraburkholderia sp. MMS20-SJTN17]
MIALFWLLAAGWLTAPLLDLAQPQRQSATTVTYAPRTAIILLGGGTIYNHDHVLVPPRDVLSRIELSARNYAACKRTANTCQIIVSGGNPQRHSATEADTYLPYLLRQQVPRSDIVLENSSRTTYENARNVSAIVGRSHYDTLILVTSAYHMPRALLDFQCFGLEPQPEISGARYARLGLLPHIDNLKAAEIALHELAGLAQFHLYRAIGWF